MVWGVGVFFGGDRRVVLYGDVCGCVGGEVGGEEVGREVGGEEKFICWSVFFMLEII